MDTITKPIQAVKLEDRIARCLTQEILRGNLSASFRLISSFPDNTAAQEQEKTYLELNVSKRVTDLLNSQKRRLYAYKDIQIETIENTIGITPVVKTRLEITVTATRL